MQSGHRQSLPAFAASVGTCKPLPSGEAALDILGRADIGKIQVFENFRGAPFALGVTQKLFGSHSLNSFGYRQAQAFEIGAHSCFSRMWPAARGRKNSYVRGLYEMPWAGVVVPRRAFGLHFRIEAIGRSKTEAAGAVDWT